MLHKRLQTIDTRFVFLTFDINFNEPIADN